MLLFGVFFCFLVIVVYFVYLIVKYFEMYVFKGGFQELCIYVEFVNQKCYMSLGFM